MKKIEREKLIDIVLSMRELKQSEFDTLFNNSEEFKNIVFIKKIRGEKNEYIPKVTNIKN